jgi:hypothetical protein
MSDLYCHQVGDNDIDFSEPMQNDHTCFDSEII